MAQYVRRKERKPTKDEKKWMKQAIERDDTATIQKMIKTDGININANIGSKGLSSDGGEYTAAHYAVVKNKLQSLRTIVQLGADITITDQLFRGFKRKTPLERAVEYYNSSIVYYLYKDCHADISKLNKEDQDIVAAMVQQYERDNTQLKMQATHQQFHQQLRGQVEQLTLVDQRHDQHLQGGQLQELVKQVQQLQQSVAGVQGGLAAEQQKSSVLEKTLIVEQEKTQNLQVALAAEQQKSQRFEASQEERLKAIEDTVERLWAISYQKARNENDHP